MKSVVIIGNGEFPKKDYPRYIIGSADIIICCDGAIAAFMRHTKEICGYEREPDLIIGDMDSISSTLANKFKNIALKISEQETNDQSKAVKYALENISDITDIHIVAATGKREDHTIGNLSLLMEYARQYDLEGRNIKMDLITDNGIWFALTDTTELHVGEGRRISIFSPDNSLKLHSDGLTWPLDNVVFDNWWKATLNKANADVIKLTFNHPSMVLINMD